MRTFVGFFDNMNHEWTDEVHRAPRGRSPDSSPDPEMVEGGGVGGRRVVGDEGRVRRKGRWFLRCSPNVYLHYVFDLWVEAWRKNVATGDVIVVRYADDLVVGFQRRAEAERFLEEFRERLAKFGLELHPEKTRLIEFGRFAALDRKQRGEGKPETFTFLGFTHYCGKRWKTGGFIVWRKTAKKRMVAKLQRIKGGACAVGCMSRWR